MFLKIIILFFLIIGTVFFQPLLMQIQFLTNDSTITGALISSASTVFGNILGGIITGLVAFYIAKRQFENEKNTNSKTQKKLDKNNKSLILKEIESNNKFLCLINEDTSNADLISILKYSISDRMYFSIKSQLAVDDDFSSFHKYYLILYRLQNDPILHENQNIEILLKEIKKLTSIKFKTPL